MKHVPALDGVRGTAILLVLLSHLIGGYGLTSPAARGLLLFCHSGWLGVDLFFVLSGFLITSILLDHPRDHRYWLDFFARRVLRIFPLYFGTLAIVFWVLPHLPACAPGVRELVPNQVWLWTFTTNLAAARGVFFNSPGVYLEHLWSLAIEEQFYLFWPGIVYFCRPPLLARVCLGIIIGSLTLRLVAAKLGIGDSMIFFATPFRLDGLAWGAFIAANRNRITELLPWARPVSITALAGLILLAGYYRDLRTTPVELALTLSCGSAFFGAILILVLDGRSWLSAFFALRSLRLLGTYSFGIYILGSLLQPHLESWLSTAILATYVRPAALAPVLHFLAHVSVYLVVAALVHHLFEQPFLKLKRHFEGAPTRVGKQAVSTAN